MQSDQPQGTPLLEVGHVLFIDVVGYSKFTLNRQAQAISELQEIIRLSPQFIAADKSKRVVSLPTGDGMALVFFGDALAAVRCALEVAASVNSRSAAPIRMGVNSGPVYVVDDINGNRNVAGSGINIAQRVMDCGEGGHILLSESVAEVLNQLDDWRESVTPLGEAEVKHHVRIPVYNLVRESAGNASRPPKLVAASAVEKAQSKQSRRSRFIAAGIQFALAIPYILVVGLFGSGQMEKLLREYTRLYAILLCAFALAVCSLGVAVFIAKGQLGKLRLGSRLWLLLLLNLPAVFVVFAISVGKASVAIGLLALAILVAALIYQRQALRQ